MTTKNDDPEAWDRYYLESGMAATLHAYGSQIAKQIKEETKTELKAEYGAGKFWEMFYQQNGDLKADDDICRAQLNENFKDLEKMEVSNAIEKLSDLSREAIAADQHRRAAQREYGVFRGGPGMAPNEIAVAPTGGTTLSQMIKKRQARRSAHQAGIASRPSADD